MRILSRLSSVMTVFLLGSAVAVSPQDNSSQSLEPHRVARVIEEKTSVRSGQPPVEIALTVNGYAWAKVVLQAPSSAPGDLKVSIRDRTGTSIAEISRSDFEETEQGLIHVTAPIKTDFGRIRVSGSGASVTVLEVARATASVTVETRIGDLVLTDLSHEGVAIVSASKAAILLEYQDGAIRRCNGFLLTPSIVITNNHCIGKTAIIAAAYYPRIYPDFRSDTMPGMEVRVTALLHTSPELDVSLLQLKTTLQARAPYALAIRRSDPSKGTPLRLVQFYEPFGWRQVVSSDGDCRVRLRPTSGNDGTTPSDFFHGCDTEKGTSGAAVLDLSGHLAGLHRVGKNAGYWSDNKAVATSSLAQLVDQLKKKDPVTYGAISVVP
jgi:hypothetical protein